MRHAVILAGGSGTRLWPASRRARPKQFLALDHAGSGGSAGAGDSLLAAAIRRGAGVADGGVVIVTAEGLVAPTAEVAAGLVPGLAAAPVIVAEPVGRNTAAAIGLAAATIAARDPDATLIVLPADQRISDDAGFRAAVARALEVVERDDAIGTLGIVPTRAETGFGYLEVDAVVPGAPAEVRRFVEKPDRDAAAAYLAGGRHLWNAGIFLASARRVLAELDAHAPAIAAGVRAIAAGAARAEDVYPGLPAVSFDHAVMERAARVITVPAAIGWDDVGSWLAVAALAAARAADPAGNAVAGTPAPVVLDGGGNFVASDDATLIVTLGVSDLVVVKHGDAVLVTTRAAAQDVRAVTAALAGRGLDDYL